MSCFMTCIESQSALFSLRPARAADDAFLFRLFGETQDQLALIRPNQALWETLVEIQYRGRKMSYGENYPAAEDAILCLGSEAAGRLLINRESDCMRIVDVAVLAQWRGQGIGTWALRHCQQQAAETGVRIELTVNPMNRARLLYESLGFRATEEDAMRVAMTWSPAAADCGSPRLS
jgi:GNAT superfamily N-acetyltransferase